MVDTVDVGLLARSQATHELLDATVTGCAYSCCGKGWQRRDGYEQRYRGYIDNLTLPDGEMQGTFMLYSTGIGTLSYVIAVRFFEVAAIDAA